MKILLPALSPTMETGNLVKWLVKEGQTVNSGDILAEIETDKATMELESPDDGIIEKIVISEGTENIPVNDLIAVLKVDDEEVIEEEISSSEIVSNNQEADNTQKIDSTVSMGSVLNEQTVTENGALAVSSGMFGGVQSSQAKKGEKLEALN